MKSFFTGAKPRFFAHRGASGETPENTLLAFRRAAEAGIAYAELDVHASRDGQVVVIHDPTLERTTNGRGRVGDYTVAELQQLDAGYWFFPDNGQTFPFRATGVTIPTLAEVFRDFPGVRFTVEIKQSDPPIEEQVVAMIRACGRAGDVILASEHDQVLVRAASLAPEMARSFAHGEGVDFMQRVVTGQLEGYQPPGQALQIPPEYNGIPLVTAETVAAAHTLGCEVHVWTINEPQEMEQLLDLGVDGIMSDFPERMLTVARRRSSVPLPRATT
ncbi:MAG: glycerophosphodiester phosphodiesterase [Candidatus Binatia bacterium]